MSVNKIESRDNPRLKHARKVRDGRVTEQIYVEGVRLAEEAVRSGLQIEECLYASSFGAAEREQELLSTVSRRCNDLFELSNRLFPSIADTKTTQGIILLCKRPAADRESFDRKIHLAGESLPLVVMLTEVNNPSNLGAVIRTAEAAGASGLIVSKNSADAFSPKALRAAMGSAFRLPVWEEAETDAVFRWARAKDLHIIAASGRGDTDYTEVDWTQRSLIVFGSEAHGLSAELVEETATKIRIPMESLVESLNLAVSVGVVLFEARRQNT